jgi:arsenate reductase
MHKTVTKPNQISILYHKNCSKGKKALAYAKSLSSSVISYTYENLKFTPTQWEQILKNMGKSPKQILDKSQPYYQANIRGRDFIEEDWLDLLVKNPHVIRGPIVTKGSRSVLLDNPTDIYKL